MTSTKSHGDLRFVNFLEQTFWTRCLLSFTAIRILALLALLVFHMYMARILPKHLWIPGICVSNLRVYLVNGEAQLAEMQ